MTQFDEVIAIRNDLHVCNATRERRPNAREYVATKVQQALVVAGTACALVVGSAFAHVTDASIHGSMGIPVKQAQSRGPTHSAVSPTAPRAATASSTTSTVVAFVPTPQALTFVPITPCRVIATHSDAPDRHQLPPDVVTDFIVRGTTGFSLQGGASGGCGIPASATAVSVSISSTDIGGIGSFRIWPYGQTEPTIPIVHYQAGPVTSTGATLTLGSDPNAAFDISVTAKGSPAGLAIDVLGYYEPQTHLVVLGSGQFWYGNNTHVVRFKHIIGSGKYSFVFDRNLTGCNVLATDNGDQTVRAAPGWGGASLTVNTYKESGGSFTHQDESFQILVSC